jgi:hypothetical protein
MRKVSHRQLNLAQMAGVVALATCVLCLLGQTADAHIATHADLENFAERIMIPIDDRPYRHCHVVFTHVYCHKKGPLPINWPPFSDRHPKKALTAR